MELRRPAGGFLAPDRTADETMKTVLFLCTGNYYRSRFAEELFNDRAARARLPWQANSRALAIERLTSPTGRLSPLVLDALEARGLLARGAHRAPTPCTAPDLAAADLIVALKEAEHRPLVVERFAGWEDRIEFWNVDDIDGAPADFALKRIDDHIDALIARIVAAEHRGRTIPPRG